MLYSDDILLIALSINELLKNYERKHEWLVMRRPIDVKIRLSALFLRFSATCTRITTLDDHSLLWVNEIRYVGIIRCCKARGVRCKTMLSPIYQRRLWKTRQVGIRTSEEIILQLVRLKSTCKPMPIVAYGLDVFHSSRPINRFCGHAISFVLFSFFRYWFFIRWIQIIRNVNSERIVSRLRTCLIGLILMLQT